MDDDIASWVAEEANRDAGYRRPASARARGTPLGAGGAAASRARAARFAVPGTPATPMHAHLERGDDAKAFGTEVFLRRAREPAFGGFAAGGGGGGGGGGPKSAAPPASAARRGDRSPDENADPTRAAAYAAAASLAAAADAAAAARDLETDDAPDARREEYAFADVLAAADRNEIAAGAAAACFESACWERAYELRDAATSAVHRTHKAAELSAEADALEREAGTWSLIWFLLGDGAVAERENAASEADAREVMRARQTLGGDPASVYDTGVENPKPTPTPLSARVRMAARDEENDPVTFRIGRVVAWLEGATRAALERAGDVDHEFEFADNECARRETANALDARATTDGRGASLSRALDPDGPTRTRAGLHPTNADGETRLLRAVWRLVRGGMIDGARELCVRAGQPWRAASLGGGAGWGPAPVGAAADRAFKASAAGVIAEALSAAAAARGAGAGGGGDDDMETEEGAASVVVVDEGALAAAVKASADGDAAAAEDEEVAAECEHGGGVAKRALWKWACSMTAMQCCGGGGGGGGDPSSTSALARYEAAVYGAFAGDVRGMLRACDGDYDASAFAYFRSLLDLRVDAAVAGRDPRAQGEVILDEDDALAAAAGDEASLGEAFAAVSADALTPRWPTPDALAAIPPTAEAILDALRPLSELRGAVGDQRDVQRCLILGRTRELVTDAITRWIFPDEKDVGDRTGDGADADADADDAETLLAPAPSAPPSLLRFAAHLLLFLQALLPDGGGLAPGGALYARVNRVLYAYADHLVAERRHELAPRYARHLRPDLLVRAYARFLDRLAPTSAETKARCLRDASEWIELEGEGGLRAIVSRTLDESREVVDASGAPTTRASSRGPAHRERILEWACLAGKALHPEAASHACALVRQLCLQRSAALATLVPPDETRGGGGASSSNEQDSFGDDATRPAEPPPESPATGRFKRAANLVKTQVRVVNAFHSAGDAVVRGETRARGVVAEILPADLLVNAAEGGAPGAANELADWAAYLAAANAVGTWRELSIARDDAAAAGLDDGAGIGGGDDDAATSLPAMTAEAGAKALDAILALTAPRRRDAATAFIPRATGIGGADDDDDLWLESPALFDANEAATAAENSTPPPAARVFAVPVPIAPPASPNERAMPVADFARLLQRAIEARRAELGVRARGITVHAEGVRGVVGEGARPIAAAGQVMLELAASSDVDVDVDASRDALVQLLSDAIKGDLPWDVAVAGPGGGGGAAAHPPDRGTIHRAHHALEVQSADGSDPEIVRATCRRVCWPSLLLEAAEIEADLGGGGRAVAERVADASRGLHAMFSTRETRWLLQLQRRGELRAIASGVVQP